MKFETLEIKFERYETLDIIATSLEEEDPTVAPTEPTTKYDPYENDKW